MEKKPKRNNKNKHFSRVDVYTDGAAVPNPGQGGWAAILRTELSSGEIVEKEISGCVSSTTNNRMELMAAIKALNALKKPCNVILYSDSMYLCNGVSKWLSEWKSRNWQSMSGKEIENSDLWNQLDTLQELHNVEWQWIKGHSDNLFNQRADKLARSVIQPQELPLKTEEGYHLYLRVTCVTGIGGWGVLLQNKTEFLEYGGWIKDTTANQLEISAAISGIKKTPEGARIFLYTHNNYIYSAIVNDIIQWRKNNWLTSANKPVKNRDLWEKLLKVQQNRIIFWNLLFRGDNRFQESKKAHEIAKEKLNEYLNSHRI